MIFITGPLYSGKRSFEKGLLRCDDAALSGRCALDVHELAAGCADLESLAERLSRYEIVTAAELGGGIVPLDPKERKARERAGQLSCLLAARAGTVVRMFCGIPTVLKGELP